MSWIDDADYEERWSEWERMLDDASSSIQSLAEDLGENSSHNVLLWAGLFTEEVVAIHGAAGVLHLPTDPVIDVAGDADLVAWWVDAEPFLDDGETDWDKESREVSVACQAIAAAARKFCDVAERALCALAGEVDETGKPSLSSLRTLADEAAKLAEWTRIYGSSVLGRYRESGSMPDSDFGGGTMEAMLEYERAEQLAAGLAGANPWQ